MVVDLTLFTTSDLSAAINFSGLKNVLIEEFSRSRWLKSPDEDTIHTKSPPTPTHTNTHAHTHTPEL